MPKLITVYWRDIPSQVIAKKGRSKSKVQLSQRFQEAIDRAAMRAGKGSSDAYLSDGGRKPPPVVMILNRLLKNWPMCLNSAITMTTCWR